MKKKETIRVIKSKIDGSWFAEIKEYPGCWAEGRTKKEALQNLEDAKHLWLKWSER